MILRYSRVCNFSAFLVGAFSRMQVELLGRISVSEIFLILLWPLALNVISKNASKLNRKLLIRSALLMFLWVVGALISDMVAGTDSDYILRGIMKPAFCLVWAVFFMMLLVVSPAALTYLAAGLAAASFQNYFLPTSTSSELAISEYADLVYRISPVILSLCLFLSVVIYKRRAGLAAICLVVAGVLIAAIGGSRSAAAIPIVSGALLFWPTLRPGRATRSVGKVPKHNKIAILVGLVVFSYLLVEVYIYAAGNGYLGEYQQIKFLRQSGTSFGNTALGLLFTGRPQIVGAVLAIMDNPVIGTGSWSANAMVDYFREGVSLVGVDRSVKMNNPRVGHSAIAVIWLEHSIMAGFSMLCFFILSVRKLVAASSLQRGPPQLPLIIYLCCLLIWDLLFSPFYLGTRSGIGLILALTCTGYPQNLDTQHQSIVQRGC
ncbi:MAG: hypothetical protein ACJAYC_000243 [Halieaceae bacterium]|jgi:hypothetical protein